MIARDDVVDVLTKCSGYDHRFPKPSDVMLEAWTEHLQQFRVLTRDDVLTAVTAYFNEPNAEVPRPVDISRHARRIHRERMDEDEARAEHEDICDLKAGDPPYSQRAINVDPATVERRREAIKVLVEAIAQRKAHRETTDE